MIARLLLNLILLIVTFVFLYSGICKITPSLNPDTYIMLEEKFRSSITPVWEKVVKESGYVQYFKIDSHKFKTALGFFEVLLIIISWLGTTGSVIGGLMLTILMGFASATHYMIDEDPGFPVFIGLLCFSVVILSLSLPLPTHHKAALKPSTKPKQVTAAKKQD